MTVTDEDARELIRRIKTMPTTPTVVGTLSLAEEALASRPVIAAAREYVTAMTVLEILEPGDSDAMFEDEYDVLRDALCAFDERGKT